MYVGRQGKYINMANFTVLLLDIRMGSCRGIVRKHKLVHVHTYVHSLMANVNHHFGLL